MKMHFKVLQLKQHLSFNYPVIRPTVVETDSASILHIISDRSLFCELRRYEVKWEQNKDSSDEFGFELIDTTHRNQNLDYYSCLDAMLDPSTNDIVCLSPRRLTFIRYDSAFRVNLGLFSLIYASNLSAEIKVRQVKPVLFSKVVHG